MVLGDHQDGEKAGKIGMLRCVPNCSNSSVDRLIASPCRFLRRCAEISASSLQIAYRQRYHEGHVKTIPAQNSEVRFWLLSDIMALSDLCPLCTRKRTLTAVAIYVCL